MTDSSFIAPAVDPSALLYTPPEYEDTYYKQQADDIVQQMRAHTSRQIEALERIAESTKQRVDVAEQNLRNVEKLSADAHERLIVAERDLEVHEQELLQAQAEAREATIRSWIAIAISAAALLIELIARIV